MNRLFSVIILAAAVVAYRVTVGLVGGDLAMQLANFTPLCALAVCAGLFLPGKSAAAVVVSTQLVSDVIISVVKRAPIHWAYVVVPVAIYAAIAFASPQLRRHFSWAKSLLGVAAATVAFYILANTASFFMDPAYAKTLQGWLQCQTVGVPGYTPAYVFLLKSLTGNLAFAGLFLAVCRVPVLGKSRPVDANVTDQLTA